ncbi:hypothetical protein [Myxococcus sp. SDU36]|uniref:hypothetical protein n=1 Tax=Myxococcus sp. SDU36 TaxID=2831967 RepID=UPI002543583B|nr:hypothetical protein [Myxococcus sp. SDU36]WIG95710.1 hypothetical protein KGD87_35525 [Myxococcus sp. SDU36]
MTQPEAEEPAVEHLDALIRRARAASEDERDLLGEELNTLLLQLPAAPEPERNAAWVRRLLESQALVGLGTSTMPATIAAMRVLLDLGYPSSLTLTPEELATLRRWEHQRFAVPWLLLLVTLCLVFLVQFGFIMMGTENALMLHFKASFDALSGEPPPPPTLMERYETFIRDTAYQVLPAQFLAGTAAFFFTVTLGLRPVGRRRARLAFLSLAVAGAVVSLLQLPANGWIAATTFVGAVGAFICAAMLKPV